MRGRKGTNLTCTALAAVSAALLASAVLPTASAAPLAMSGEAPSSETSSDESPSENTTKPSPLTMVPTTRILDTREGVGAPTALEDGQTVDIQITGNIATITEGGVERNVVIPDGADSVTMNLTAVDARDDGFLTVWKSGTEQPDTSDISFNAGKTVAGRVTLPVSDDGKISVFCRGGADVLMDVTGYHDNGAYTPMRPRRLYDSRDNGGMVQAKSVTHIQTGFAQGDVVSVNITSDDAAKPGYFSAWATPAGEGTSRDQSPATSTLNYAPGLIVANTTVSRVGVDGMISVYSHEDANLIVDLTQHTPGAAAEDVIHVFDRPRRAHDSRIQGPQKSSNTGDPRYWLSREGGIVGSSGLRNGAERDAQAVVVNLTVTNTPSDGFASLTPFLIDGDRPLTSTINYTKGETRANRAIVPLDLYGYISAYASNQSDLIVDLLGYIPKAKNPSAARALDLSDSSYSHILTTAPNVRSLNMAERNAIQFWAEDPDGNGEMDWEMTGEPALLGHSHSDTIAEYQVVDGPQVDGSATKRVLYTGSPLAWRHEGKGWNAAGGAVKHQYPETLGIPLRHRDTGATVLATIPMHGHWEDHEISGTDGPAGAAGSSVASAPPMLDESVYLDANPAAVGVTTHEQTFNVTLPEDFAALSDGEFRVYCEDLPFDLLQPVEERGLVSRDSDGDNQVSVTLPTVSDLYHPGAGQLFWKYPSVTMRVEGTTKQGEPMWFAFQAIRE